MINSKKDLRYYLNEDKRALGLGKRKSPSVIGDEIWKFQIFLRKREYYTNKRSNPWSKLMKMYYIIKHRTLGMKLGFTIPPNVFGPGLRINHCGLIVINHNVRIGANCGIHQGVNIGQNHNEREVPTLGNNIWIGPGVKIFGKIVIADSVAIGANSVVNKSCLEENVTIAGIPAKKIKNTGTIEMRAPANFGG